MSSREYGSRYQAHRATGSQSTADVLAPALMEKFGPRSVVDVGCGLGGWLKAMQAVGVQDFVGIDGPWGDPDHLLISPSRFRAMDLREPLDVPDRFDMAISVEVAEHLPPERSAGFVADLVALAPIVVFSAAIPGQGGRGHINERWQSEWARMFAEHGLAPRRAPVSPVVRSHGRVVVRAEPDRLCASRERSDGRGGCCAAPRSGRPGLSHRGAPRPVQPRTPDPRGHSSRATAESKALKHA